MFIASVTSEQEYFLNPTTEKEGENLGFSNGKKCFHSNLN